MRRLLLDYLNKEIEYSGIVISKKKDRALIRDIKVNERCVADHIWIGIAKKYTKGYKGTNENKRLMFPEETDIEIKIVKII